MGSCLIDAQPRHTQASLSVLAHRSKALRNEPSAAISEQSPLYITLALQELSSDQVRFLGSSSRHWIEKKARCHVRQATSSTSFGYGYPLKPFRRPA